MRDKARHEISGGAPLVGIVHENLADTAGRRALVPMGRTKASNTATLLIDEDRGVRAFHGLAQGCGERADLLGRLAIAREQDEPEGANLAEEFTLFPGQYVSLTAIYSGARPHGDLVESRNTIHGDVTKQVPPWSLSFSQASAAADLLAKGPALNRNQMPRAPKSALWTSSDQPPEISE